MNNKITCKKLKTFPSLEWGPDGGFCADIYFDGVKQGYFHQAGEGGEYVFQPESFDNPAVKSNKELNQYCVEYFKNNKFARLYSSASLEAVERFCNLETMVCHCLAMKTLEKKIKQMVKDGKYSKYYIVLKEPSELYDSNNVFSFLTTKNSTEASIKNYISIQTMTKNWKDDEKFFTYTFESVEDLFKLI